MREVGGELCITEHHGHDRMLAGDDVESCRRHALAKIGGVLPKLPTQRIAVLQDVEHTYRRRRYERRNAVREQIWSRALTQPRDDLPTTRGITAHSAAERFAERARQDVDATHHIAVLVRAASFLADESCRMRVIDHDERIVAIRELADFT